MITCGIDPGISGAISFFNAGILERVIDLPVIEIVVGKGKRRQLVPAALAEALWQSGLLHSPDHVYLEHVSSRPGEGAVGAFSFGRGFGQIEGTLAGMGLPYTLVHPGKWKKALGVPADKGGARMRACREWPAFAGYFARVKDDGRAEAALIGLYGLSQGRNA